MAVDARRLDGIELLAGINESERATIARHLHRRTLAAQRPLIRQGEAPTSFALITDGQFVVSRRNGGEVEELALVGPGSIVGELALLRGRPRLASVVSQTDGAVLTGDRAALLSLLRLPAVRERLRELVSLRLAEDAMPVSVRTPDATEFQLRPLLPADRDQLVAGIEAMSDKSLHSRFFTGGRPAEAVIDHLLDIDYLDHFAWVLGTPEGEGLAVARYHRMPDDPAVADVAFAVVDNRQGAGIGTLLLGALATAAHTAGIERFHAEVLTDNRPMRAVFDKVDASWTRVEPGVVATDIDVRAARDLMNGSDADAVERAVREIVTAAGLAGFRRVR